MPDPGMFQIIVEAKVRSWLGVLFLGSFALGASLLVWHVAHNTDPLTNALVPYVTPQDGGY